MKDKKLDSTDRRQGENIMSEILAVIAFSIALVALVVLGIFYTIQDRKRQIEREEFERARQQAFFDFLIEFHDSISFEFKK